MLGALSTISLMVLPLSTRKVSPSSRGKGEYFAETLILFMLVSNAYRCQQNAVQFQDDSKRDRQHQASHSQYALTGLALQLCQCESLLASIHHCVCTHLSSTQHQTAFPTLSGLASKSFRCCVELLHQPSCLQMIRCQHTEEGLCHSVQPSPCISICVIPSNQLQRSLCLCS